MKEISAGGVVFRKWTVYANSTDSGPLRQNLAAKGKMEHGETIEQTACAKLSKRQGWKASLLRLSIKLNTNIIMKPKG